MGNTSGTGVLFTRNPSTGEKKLYGEFLINAQVIYDLITSFYLIFVNHAIIISISSK
jgi:phosphoenolpyruvate synthase/pyruvate phosphate dikinase